MKSYRFFVIGLAFLLASCNLPSKNAATESPNAILTAAAQTVEASLTQAALANTPTPLPPTDTPPPPPPTATLAGPLPTTPPLATATQNCDKADFITDVTISDGTTLNANESFVKTWRLKNIGTCSWTPSYTVVFESGDAMSGPAAQALSGNVNPGQTVDISVNLKAPSANGTYRGNWALRNAAGVIFARFYVDIKVGGGGGGGSGTFAVTSVSFNVSGSCGNFTITANITANGPGTVTYKWVRSDGASDNAAHDPIEFAAAGTKSVSTQWFVAAVGSHWMDIYIDKPNHQQFGRANFSCP